MNDDLHLLPSSFIVHRIIRNAGCSTPMGAQHPMPRTAEAQPRRTRGPGAPRLCGDYGDDYDGDDDDDDDYDDDDYGSHMHLDAPGKETAPGRHLHHDR